MSDEEIKAYQPAGIILAGGPESVTEVPRRARPNVYFRWVYQF